MKKIKIIKIKDSVVIHFNNDNGIIYSDEGMITVTIFGLASIIKFLLYRGFMSPKVLEGVLSEYYDDFK